LAFDLRPHDTIVTARYYPVHNISRLTRSPRRSKFVLAGEAEDLKLDGVVLILRKHTPSVQIPFASQDMELLRISINGTPLSTGQYTIQNDQLIIPRASIPAGCAIPHHPSVRCTHANTDAFELETVVKIHPDENTKLAGLYQSSGTLCTQCEAEGFRRITYFLDRPDIMSRYLHPSPCISKQITSTQVHCPANLRNQARLPQNTRRRST
jgi:hypothetical protein